MGSVRLYLNAADLAAIVMKNSMESIVEIDAEGRIRLPDSVLRELQVAGGSGLLVTSVGGRVELRSLNEPSEAVLVKENGVTVAANATDFDAVAAIRSVREDRL